MRFTPRIKQTAATIVIGAGLAAGAVGVASAVTSPGSTPTAAVLAATPTPAGAPATATPAVDQPEANDTIDNATDPNGPNDAAGANDGPDAADTAYQSSVTAPQGAEYDDSTEAASLQPLAKVTEAEAVKAALAAVPGTASTATLENENGNVVYSVPVKTVNGTVDVKVDAGNAKVLAHDSGADDQTSD